MNELQIFKNEEFGQVRTVSISNEPYFVGKDVAIALGYANPRDALSKHVDSEDKGVANCDTLGGKQELTVINESGLYSLVFGSNLPSAKQFKHWVTKEVLPSIRATGSYVKPLSEKEIMRIQLEMLDDVSVRVDKLENTMVIDYGQQRVLERLVNSIVIISLGGKDSNAYKEISKKVFSECNRDIKDHFNVNSRNNIPRLRFDEACGYIKKWQPCTNTKILIEDTNAQMNIA